MTALPYDPYHTYTVEEFAALPVDKSARYELREGHIVVSPRPARRHMIILGKLFAQIDSQLPSDLLAIPEIDVDLELLTPGVRVPDLVVTRADLDDQGHLTKASDVLLAIEVLSPATIRTDTKIKPIDYADAGIPNLWLIDPQPPVTATVYRLIGEDYEDYEDYEESQRCEHGFTVAEPAPLAIDLDALLPRA